MKRDYQQCITFDDLHHHLMLDPLYGVENTCSEVLIAAIYEENKDNSSYRSFAYQFGLLPCSDDAQRHLIYILCVLMGLPAYRNDRRLDWNHKELFREWTSSFDIRLHELRDLLRGQSWPLPSTFFPDEVDSTVRKANLEATEYEHQMQLHLVTLPKLENSLVDLKIIQPADMAERKRKDREIELLEHRIHAINTGDEVPLKETFEERCLRLLRWFEEEVRLKGPRGARTRTAKREGIALATLSAILNKALKQTKSKS